MNYKATAVGAALALISWVPLIHAQTTATDQARDGDPDAGKRVFAQCHACHSIKEGQNRAGPHLFNIIGRPAGSIDGARYSKAMQGSDIIWTEDEIIRYILDPRGVLPGTSMMTGLRRADQAPDLMAYLRTLQSE